MDIPTKIMRNIDRNRNFLHLLSSSSPSQKKAILRTATKDQIYSVCEICKNVLNGVLPVNVKRLSKYKSQIRQMNDKKIPWLKKRRLLIKQTGGFLPLLLPAVLTALGGIVGRAIGNRI